jgi:hypothetical protein
MIKESKIYDYDWQGGPVYKRLSAESTHQAQCTIPVQRSWVIDVLVIDPEACTRELRRYFALNLAQATARAAELQIRLREMGYEPILTDLRRSTNEEVDDFFRAIDCLERQMPQSILDDRNP